MIVKRAVALSATVFFCQHRGYSDRYVFFFGVFRQSAIEWAAEKAAFVCN